MPSPQAQAVPGPRQVYSKSWTHNRSRGYYFKIYNYRPTRGAGTYQRQYMVYKPTRTREWVYWYNPQTKKYWARCPTIRNAAYGARIRMGAELWSFLPDTKKKRKLDEIRDSDFGPVRNTSPSIPGARDGETIQVPPNDLPDA
jgi:hypothetical protein